jgi:hopanoid biosynthesis associated protein HpnK
VKRLIVTADDFGLSVPVNEAVEDGHRRGILTAASLMVGAPGFEDAVRRARQMPTLGVGLHLVLLDGKPVLPPEAIPDLVDSAGDMTTRPHETGAAIFLRRSVRRQVEAEMRAQFEAFRRTGLPLDHVNGHHHYHVHPNIVTLLIEIGREYGVRAVRVPYEPLWRSWRAIGDGWWRRLGTTAIHFMTTTPMRHRLTSAGIASNDAIFGLNDSGAMTRDRVLRFIDQLPEGTSELYCHPATRRWPGPYVLPEGYRCIEEYEALVDPEVVAAVRGRGIELIPFAALSAQRRAA